MILWIVIGVFAFASAGFVALAVSSITPGGVNTGGILFVPAALCGAVAVIGVLLKVAVHFLLKV